MYQVFVGGKQQGKDYIALANALIVAESCARVHKQVYVYRKGANAPKTEAKWVDGKRVQ